MTSVIPQSFIDSVTLSTDEILETLKREGAQLNPDDIEGLSLFLFDKRGMITDTEHRQVLSCMCALLALRVVNS